MARHRKPSSQFPRRAAVAFAVGGTVLVMDNGRFVGVSPFDVNATDRLPVVNRTVQPAVQASSTVTAVPGDTVSKLARENGQTWQELWSRNLTQLPNPDVLAVGQTLSLDAPTQPLPVRVPAPAPAPARTAPPVAQPAVPSAGSSSVVAAARQYIGVPYRWGGKSASGLDCSGLVYLALQEAGLTDRYRTSAALQSWTVPISRSEARAGDLVFGPGHVGIYLGNGKMIDAPKPGTAVGVHSVYSFMTNYGRIPE